MIYTHEPDWYDLLTWMLERSPKLQVLKLVDEYTKHRVSGWEWNKPKDIPECLKENEEEVATYILKNARGLKNATFSTDLM
ncbi:hypothetical protein Bca52824_089740 [Brassica carinata]|uniref:FBD domain-containing protein n=1 Tax=Brassica carinata TaxID=52824 RepID=A0A8X7TQ22_BRACI|nr:hypothetical protein Bca52824_089740 [Brassica carinata]